MIQNNSPWIKQLNRTRPAVSLQKNDETDVVIVGGGIAGVTTAFFVLKHTNLRVILVEAGKVAHGATGHNAGQITSYFERPLHELAEEFGLDLAINAQRSIESSWELLDEIYAEANLQTPFYDFLGHAGLSNFRQVETLLKDNWCRHVGGIAKETFMIAEEWEERVLLHDKFQELYTVVPQKKILELLETKNQDYIATLSYKKGCLNSALFSEELVNYLATTYKDRFTLYEESPVNIVRLQNHEAKIEVKNYVIATEKVVLCTNGFAHFKIINEYGKEINTSFHHSVHGRVGYMAGYLEESKLAPTAISYFAKGDGDPIDDPTGESYFYITRRPFDHQEGVQNLISTGGPDRALPNGAQYVQAEDPHAEDAQEAIENFLSSSYENYPKKGAEFKFSWHGLMGYTPSGVRVIGPEPRNPALLYNLGCNGIGILPSIYGSKKISQFLLGRKLGKSLFDPRLK